ncbi:Alpha/Beta hydrolase protein [Chaetomium fimeti]|uniref:Alpha/Beta hydrolase protein n=1 Tax=Chaetomium fimeti TaxID=1854472 RepID=A0AAE0HKY3_9PEZI|nr:Alpha/Beta hydrolase protein [Chaetomium fimeti]
MNTQSEKRRKRPGSTLAKMFGAGIWGSRSVHAGATSTPMLNGSADISAMSRSAPHSAGTSQALAKASIFLDTLPKCSAVNMSQQRALDRYLAAIERQEIHRIESHEASEFKPAEETWQLISRAVLRAQRIYSDVPYSPHDTLLNPSSYSKKTTISDDELPNGNHAIVVTVRGSARFKDWLVNLNEAPVMEHESLQPPQQCHRGFLAVAKDMQGNVLKAIVEKLDGMANAGRPVDLLFTGHSAGGAIAKLFYAMSSSPGGLFSSVIPRFRHVHCIVFGAPPVVASPILKPRSPHFQSGLFLNVVNERDPIPLAQQEYIHLLLNCFSRAQESKEPSTESLRAPKPILRVSGTCIVLMDVCGETGQTEWRAVEVAPEVLETKLFGDPTMHDAGNYVARIDAARLAGHLEVRK